MKKARFKKLGFTPVILTIAVVVSVVLPLLVVIAQSFNPTTETPFPPEGVSLRWYFNIFQTRFISGVKYSIIIGFVSSSVSLIIGIGSSLALVRRRFVGKDFFNVVVFTPLIIPEVVTGLAFLLLYIKLKMTNSLINITIVHTILAIPYTLRIIMAGLYRFDIGLEDAAMSLGAKKLATLREITLPLIKPSLIAAWIFAFVVSFNNLTATLFLVRGRATAPVEIFSYIMHINDPTIAAFTTLLILGTVIIVMLIGKIIGLERISS